MIVVEEHWWRSRLW